MAVDERWSPAWWGFGFGCGIFASIFAGAGSFLLINIWLPICNEQRFNPGKFGYAIIMSIVYLVCVGWAIPFSILYNNWLVSIVCYLLAISYISCFYCSIKGFTWGNPFYKMCKCLRKDSSNQISFIDRDGNVDYGAINREVYNWLQDIGLQYYCPIFLREGYHNIREIMTITEQDLNHIGIVAYRHKQKILQKIAAAKTGLNAYNNTDTNKTNDNAGESIAIALKPLNKNDKIKHKNTV